MDQEKVLKLVTSKIMEDKSFGSGVKKFDGTEFEVWSTLTKDVLIAPIGYRAQQAGTAPSTTEAEYIVVFETTEDSIYLDKLISFRAWLNESYVSLSSISFKMLR